MSSISFLRNIFKVFRGHKKTFFIFGFFINALILAMPMYTSQVFDKFLTSGNFATLSVLTLITIVAISISSIIEHARNVSMLRIADSIYLDNVIRILQNNLYLDNASIAKIESGQFIRDFLNIKNFISSNFVFSIFDAPWTILYLIILMNMSPWVGLFAIITVIAFILVNIAGNIVSANLIKKENDKNVRSIQELSMAARNRETLISMGIMKNLLFRWGLFHTQNISQMSDHTATRIGFSGITKFLKMIFSMFTITICSILSIKGGMGAGYIIACSILIGKVTQPFEIIIINWQRLIDAKTSYERILNAIREAENEKPLANVGYVYGKIELKNICFTHLLSKKVILDNVTLTINQGESIAVVGDVGSGKSTLVKLILGLLTPQSGQILVDGNNILDIDKASIGKFIGYLPQDIELFNTTIRNNIGRLEENISDEEILKVCSIVDISDFIKSFPEGYNTIIGGAVNISGGQKQLIALARALYGKTRVLILDEPNANLDKNSEEKLKNAMLYAKSANITCVIVTHKESIIDILDKVIRIENGRITEIQILKDSMESSINDASDLKEDVTVV